jgi:hypothetical protein
MSLSSAGDTMIHFFYKGTNGSWGHAKVIYVSLYLENHTCIQKYLNINPESRGLERKQVFKHVDWNGSIKYTWTRKYTLYHFYLQQEEN